MPGEGQEPDDLPFDDEDFDNEDFEEGADQHEELGDDADNSGVGRGSEHSSEPSEVEGLGERDQGQVDRPSRASARVETALREAREARERADALEAQIRQLTQSQSRASDEVTERALMERMDPYERAEYVAQRAERNTQNALGQLRQDMADNSDRAEFSTQCAANANLAKIKDEVESTLSQLRKAGSTAPRATIAAFLIGQKVLAKAPAARASAGKKAAERVNRERARPTGSGSDVTGGRTRDERSARLERLNNASI